MPRRCPSRFQLLDEICHVVADELLCGGWLPVFIAGSRIDGCKAVAVGVVVAVIFHCFSFVCPVGRFFFQSRAKRRKKRTTGRQRGTTEGEGEGPRGGQGKCQTALSFGAQPCCPEGPSRSEAEWSPSPRECRKDARPSASEKLLLPCRVRQLERGKTG